MKILDADTGNISFMYNRHSNPKLGMSLYDKGAGKFLPYTTDATGFIEGINIAEDSVDITFNLNEINRDKFTRDEFENSVKTVIAYLAQLLDTSDIY